MGARPTTILVVDDEPQIHRLLKASLGGQRIELREADSASAALLRLAEAPVDVVILDLGLPDQGGLQVISWIRETSTVPIVVLTVHDDDESKVRAFDLGADDYLTKPFSTAELAARIRAALRHRFQEKGTRPLLRCGDLAIDLVDRRVSRGGQEIRLSRTEYELLCLLAEHAGKVLTHDFILRQIWGQDKAKDMQYLRVYIGALRRKIGDRLGGNELIRTEPRIGYRLDAPDQMTAPII
jgi:two-component system KDP operon response regulator KdpE